MTEEFKEGLIGATCRWCGKRFWARRSSAQYCCAGHKQKIYRWRVNLRKATNEALRQIRIVGQYLSYGESVPTAVANLKTLQTEIREQLVSHKVKDVQ